MRRRLFRILLALLILVVVALIAVQIILWTDLPRRIIVSRLQQQLGLRIEARSLSTGWLGNTSLRDVKLSLPLADESFLDVPRMEIGHTALLPLALTRRFSVQEIELQSPSLIARRDSAGRWNLQNVLELIQRATAGTPDPTKKKRPPALPRLSITDGTVTIIERDGQRAVIEPLTATGYPDGRLVYRYDVEVPNQLKAVGELAPGSDYKHEVRFVLQPRQWLTPWVQSPPTPLRLDGQWTGFVTDGAVAGRLNIEDAQFEKLTARGRVGVQAGGDRTVISPQNLVINTPLAAVPDVRIGSGNVQIEGPAVSIQQLRVGAIGGQAQFDGSANLDDKTADLFGTWRDLALPAEIKHSGNLKLSVKSAFPGRPEVTGEIITRGQLRKGVWDGRITVAGSGANWSAMDWLVQLPHLTWTSKLNWSIRDLALRLNHRDSLITLTEVTWPTADLLTARGELNLANRDWFLRARGRGTLPDETLAQGPVPFDFNIDVLGNRERVHLNEVFVNARGVRLRADGDYITGVPEPVALSVYLTHMPGQIVSPAELPIAGRLHSEGHLRGTLDPIKLRFVGVVTSDDLVVLERPYGDIRGAIEGNYNGDTAQFLVRDLSLFGGQWTINGIWPYDQPDRMAPSEVLRIDIGVEDLSLDDVAQTMRTQNVKGTLDGKWTLDVTRPRRNLIALRGSFNASDVAFAAFSADSITGQTDLRNGNLRLDPIEMRKGEEGKATATIETTLADMKKASVSLTAAAWPVAISDRGSAAVWADTHLDFDGATKSASGPVKARALIATTQQALGEVSIAGELRGRVAALENIQLSALGGSAQGHLTLNADDPARTHGLINWSNIEGQRIADLFPALEGLAGTYSGDISIDPAASPRALEPLHVRVQIEPSDGAFRTIALGPARLSAFLNLDKNFILQRIVLDEPAAEQRQTLAAEVDLDARNVPHNQRPVTWNDIRIADGRIKLWARRGQHPAGDVQTHIIADFNQLSLDPIVHAFKSDAEPMPARLHGQLILHGDPGDPDAILGDGRLRITDSDLAKFDPLAMLYDLLNVLGRQDADGNGSLTLSLQRSTLTLNNIQYFNRGVEAFSSDLTIRDVWKMPDSPFEGYIVGTARPLSALDLPLIVDVDKILSVLQTNLTTVHIDGTVAEPNPAPATFQEVGGGLKRFLSGKVTEQRR